MSPAYPNLTPDKATKKFILCTTLQYTKFLSVLKNVKKYLCKPIKFEKHFQIVSRKKRRLICKHKIYNQGKFIQLQQRKTNIY